jgi:hypothetical protein
MYITLSDFDVHIQLKDRIHSEILTNQEMASRLALRTTLKGPEEQLRQTPGRRQGQSNGSHTLADYRLGYDRPCGGFLSLGLERYAQAVSPSG